MTYDLTFFGAAEQVTGSLYLIRTDSHTVLLECGLVQGSREDEERNGDPFPVSVGQIDAVVLSHAHIDHSGRVPLLVKRGFQGPVYTQHATRELCKIMLPDSGYLNEKDAEWENRKRRNAAKILPLYTRADAEACLSQFHGIDYEEDREIVPGLSIRFRDAGHILGSAIVELTYTNNGESHKLVFSGDLGYRDAPVMQPPKIVRTADTVLMESTYGDRLHRPYDETIDELAAVFEKARAAGGNILIPAFAVGRTQDLLFLLSTHSEEWGLRDWNIFLDSPMAIQATEVYSRNQDLYDVKFFEPGTCQPKLPHFFMTRSTEESMAINRIESGAIIIAGSGMCTGGRIRHHLKNNIWRSDCHVVIVGFQAYGTLGRRLVEGADEIRLWGDTYRVRSEIHTIGGLSAHGDQADLLDWYGSFENKPPVYLVHGEPGAQARLAAEIHERFQVHASIARYRQKIDIAGR
jgi:metallo-beta-lactamase family protein